ncbi:hypothetical protein BsWGS_24995 [Bradybaena similaris]
MRNSGKIKSGNTGRQN